MRALLFDLDGVLVDTYRVWHAVLNAFAGEHGYAAISERAMEAAWGQGVDADRASFFPGTTVPDLEAFYNARFPDHIEQLEVIAGGGEAMRRLAKLGIATAVITNTPAPLARLLLGRAGAEPVALVGGTDVPRPKPAPDMVLRACELLATTPAEAAVVGDSDYDRDAARAAGALFIGFRRPGDRRVEELAELPELLVSLP